MILLIQEEILLMEVRYTVSSREAGKNLIDIVSVLQITYSGS